MTRYRNALPQLGGDCSDRRRHRNNLDLPGRIGAAGIRCVSPAEDIEGEAALRKYFRTYAEIATRFGGWSVLESATWRASRTGGRKIGYGAESSSRRTGARSGSSRRFGRVRDRADSDGDQWMRRSKGRRLCSRASRCRSGSGDLSWAASRQSCASTAADMVCAVTMNYVEEAVGVVRAARRADMPVAISFTVETDGNFQQARPEVRCRAVDAETSGYASYFGINCAHPSHFEPCWPAGRTMVAANPGPARERLDQEPCGAE